MPRTTINTELFFDAVKDKTNVKGFTHDFYNYPARFSPIFVREAIKTFSKPGDLIIDPFVGGGTTLIEAKMLNRHSIGFDISSLATFITKTKITPLKPKETEIVKKWFINVIGKLNCHVENDRSSTWLDNGYHKNISDKLTWPIRKIIELLIEQIELSKLTVKQQNFLRCCILKTGQWALDNKKIIPTASRFREKLVENIYAMCIGACEFYNSLSASNSNTKTFCINRPSSEINKVQLIKKMEPPSLILTSPPYPGVHIVYHRWQVQGKKETPAPFWIANSLDGHGLTHYIMGGRQQRGLENYFANILETFTSIHKICSKETLIIQMLAFSDISWQLPKYLDVMNSAGFQEVHFTDDRVWRAVPNRKWYADNKGMTDSSKEVVLFHKLIG